MWPFKNKQKEQAKKELIATIERASRSLAEARIIVADLETYGYTCEAGDLKDSIPFRRLKKLL